MPASSITRLQTPLRALFLRKLSANYRRPPHVSQSAQRGQPAFSDMVRNVSGINLIEVNYAANGTDIEIGCRNGGAAAAIVSISTNSGAAGAPANNGIGNNELDTVTFAAPPQDSDALASQPPTTGGRRRIQIPRVFPAIGDL